MALEVTVFVEMRPWYQSSGIGLH